MKYSGGISAGVIILISSVSYVFGNFMISNQDIEVRSLLSKNVFPESSSLNSNIIAVQNNSDIRDYQIIGSCKIVSSFLGEKDSVYYFSFSFEDKNCKNPYISLSDGKKIFQKSTKKINILSLENLYSTLLDLSDEQLGEILLDISQETKKLSLYKDLVIKDIVEQFDYAEKKRRYQELLYKKEVIEHIKEKRKLKYLSPVKDYPIPTALSKIPNARRPYREGFTDGIHHAWDIDAPPGTNVQALDDGIIIRIVANWEWATLSNIRKGKGLTEEDMQRNLDILRGNQVWIKTMKGELVMYNHMETISSTIKEGDFVERGTILGTIGITGVPEHGYADSHLDFSIRENPYLISKTGKYEIEDYMFWDWKMKGKTVEYILSHQNDIFETISGKNK